MNLYRDFIYTIYDNGLIEKYDNNTKETFYYYHHWRQYLRDYSYASESYLCSECLRAKKLVEGFTRFDSLVVCKEHYKPMLAMNEKLIAAVSGLDKETFDKACIKIDQIVEKIEID